MPLQRATNFFSGSQIVHMSSHIDLKALPFYIVLMQIKKISKTITAAMATNKLTNAQNPIARATFNKN